MNEPEDHTGWIDSGGDVWIRTDDMPGQWGCWWPVCDGPGWDPHARGKVGVSQPWVNIDEFHGPWTPAPEDRTERALQAVRAAYQS